MHPGLLPNPLATLFTYCLLYSGSPIKMHRRMLAIAQIIRECSPDVIGLQVGGRSIGWVGGRVIGMLPDY